MALITLPAKFSFTSVSRFALVRQSNILRSRYTGQGQRVTYPYAVWEFEGKLVEYDGQEAANIRAFLADLEGVQNTFKLPVPGAPKRTMNGTVWTSSTNGFASRSTSMTVTKGGPGAIAGFSKGDYFVIQDELKIVTDNMAFDANGMGVVYFKPGLRKPVAQGNTQLETLNPYCLMHAVEDDVAGWSLAPPIRHGIELKAIEAVDI